MDLFERVLNAIKNLRSEDGENPEYDRALYELGAEVLEDYGYDRDMVKEMVDSLV